MNANQFVSSVSGVDLDYTFNPYKDCCPIYDLPDAAKNRKVTLQKIVTVAASAGIDSLWIGRDLGYRGGRRTGMALTDDLHMDAHGERWGVKIKRPTIGAPVGERTATVIWSILSRLACPVFLWNVFPFHPHEENTPFSNRSHNSKERVLGEDILAELIDLLRPKRLVAIGNDAEKSALKLANGRQVIQIRHPSYGGQTQFLEQMSVLYKLPKSPSKNLSFSFVNEK